MKINIFIILFSIQVASFCQVNQGNAISNFNNKQIASFDDSTKTISLTFSFLPTGSSTPEFIWLIEPELHLNNKNSFASSFGYFKKQAHGHLFGSYIPPNRDFGQFPTLYSVTDKGSALYVSLSHANIFSLSTKNNIEFKLYKGLGFINLHNQLTDGSIENHTFIDINSSLMLCYNFKIFKFSVSPIAVSFSHHNNTGLWTYRPKISIGIVFF